MGTYVYTITRKARKISGVKIHTCEYAYKCGGSMFDIDDNGRSREDRLSSKIVAPRERAWKKAGENGESIKDALFVHDYEDGADVMRRTSVAFYDTGSFGEVVGRLYMNGENGRFRYVPNPVRGYKVTFKGSKIYDHTNGVPVRNHPDVVRYVDAINEERARNAAVNNYDAEAKLNNIHGCRPFEAHNGVEVVACEKPMDREGALSLAMRALDKTSDYYSLSDRVAARKILKEMMS